VVNPIIRELNEELENLKSCSRFRSLIELDFSGNKAVVKGRELLCFASNDYLALSLHPEVKKAAIAAIEKFGTGAAASRLVTGTRSLHFDLERELATYKMMPQAVVYPTGYMANLGVMTALAKSNCRIISDALNHASIIDACKLSNAEVSIYRHLDYTNCLNLVKKAVDDKKHAIIVSDLVFSMDGDACDLDALSNIAKEYGALLVLDEAHSILFKKITLDSNYCINGADVIRIGTLSKMFGSLGGYVAAKEEIVNYLINKSRPFIFTTGLSPADCAAGLKSLQILNSSEGKTLVEKLKKNISLISEAFNCNITSPIIPFVVGSDDIALRVSDFITDCGLYVPAIRPPSVPEGTSRLRITVNSAHTSEDLTRLIESLYNCIKKFNINEDEALGLLKR
jgi:8-amino-7-oxononanoate synthase